MKRVVEGVINDKEIAEKRATSFAKTCRSEGPRTTCGLSN